MSLPEHDPSSEERQPSAENPAEEKSFFQIIVHSFFIVPFLIAVFCVVVFVGVRLLTQENRTAYDYLEDVKIGGSTKRWQGAFELSKMLADERLRPTEERFSREMISAFEASEHDDPRVRQYLALAMGRAGEPEFATVIGKAIADEENEDNILAMIYALGLLSKAESVEVLTPFLKHQNPRVRSIAVTSLGAISHPTSLNSLKNMLQDPEPNVKWGSALSLARLGDRSGIDVIQNLLSRSYYESFERVDQHEQNQLIFAAIKTVEEGGFRELIPELEQLSRDDPNMKIRSAAMNAIHTFQKNR